MFEYELTMIDISLNLVVCNEEQRLSLQLPILKKLFSEIVIVVQNSDDNTLQIASKYADVIITTPRIGFCEADRILANKASFKEWILILDADEMPSDRFIKEIPTLISQNVDGYYTPRENRLKDKVNVEDKKYRLCRKNCIKYGTLLHSDVYPVTDNVKQLNYVCIIHNKTYDEFTKDFILYQKIAKETPQLMEPCWIDFFQKQTLSDYEYIYD